MFDLPCPPVYFSVSVKQQCVEIYIKSKLKWVRIKMLNDDVK